MSHYKDQVHDRDIPVCPSCGQRATEIETQYGIRNQCDDCDLWSWDRYPLVDLETHEARKAAHAAFDGIWRQLKISRSEAYRLLADELEIDPEQCHMKFMDKALAGRVPAVVQRIKLKTYDSSSALASAFVRALEEQKKRED